MNISRRALLAGSASVAALGGLALSRAALAADAADIIIFGGAIVTMNDAEPSAEAVAVKDGKIAALGAVADIRAKWEGPGTRLIDLQGKALLPGFIDGARPFHERAAHRQLGQRLAAAGRAGQLDPRHHQGAPGEHGASSSSPRAPG